MGKAPKRTDRRPKRHEEALERQALRAARTDQQQLARLDAHGYTAAHERARLGGDAS